MKRRLVLISALALLCIPFGTAQIPDDINADEANQSYLAKQAEEAKEKVESEINEAEKQVPQNETIQNTTLRQCREKTRELENEVEDLRNRIDTLESQLENTNHTRKLQESDSQNRSKDPEIEVESRTPETAETGNIVSKIARMLP